MVFKRKSTDHWANDGKRNKWVLWNLSIWENITDDWIIEWTILSLLRCMGRSCLHCRSRVQRQYHSSDRGIDCYTWDQTDRHSCDAAVVPGRRRFVSQPWCILEYMSCKNGKYNSRFRPQQDARYLWHKDRQTGTGRSASEGSEDRLGGQSFLAFTIFLETQNISSLILDEHEFGICNYCDDLLCTHW